MTDRLLRLSDDELGAALGDLRLGYPAVDVAAAVRVRIEAEPRARVVPMRRSRTLRRAVIAAVAAVLLLGGAALAGRLGVPGLRVVFAPNEAPSNIPVGRNLFLGSPSDLADARDRLPFPVLTPHGQGLGPAAVYVGAEPESGRVSLVYPARPGLPSSSFTHAGLLITEFLAHVDEDLLKKIVSAGTSIEAVHIQGDPGLWFSGAPHELQFLDRDGLPFQESIRLAGNTVVWTRGTETIRLECHCSRATALRIARSMR